MRILIELLQLGWRLSAFRLLERIKCVFLRDCGRLREEIPLSRHGFWVISASLRLCVFATWQQRIHSFLRDIDGQRELSRSRPVLRPEGPSFNSHVREGVGGNARNPLRPEGPALVGSSR